MEGTTTITFKLGGAKISADICKLYHTENDTSARIQDNVLHYHAKHELFFIGDEELTVYHSGGCETFSKCILCIPGLVKHRTVRSKSDTCLLFSFTPTSSQKSEFCRFAEEFFNKDDIFAFTTASSQDRYINELFLATREQTALSNEAAVAALQLIFYNIMKTNSVCSAKKASSKESYLILIENIIDNQSLDPAARVDLGTAAKELHLSRKQTARIIYKYYGTTLSELVNEKRLEVAELLLTTTDLSISEVSARSGYSTDNYFFTKFKKRYGISPLAYRITNKNKNQN